MLVRESEPLREILPENTLREVLDQRMVKGLRVTHRRFGLSPARRFCLQLFSSPLFLFEQALSKAFGFATLADVKGAGNESPTDQSQGTTAPWHHNPRVRIPYRGDSQA